jgi:gliding motility-associated-like protein
MSKYYSGFFILFLLLTGATASKAQLSGTNCFLQGAYLEIGELRNGAFGANGIPAGYHPHLSGTGIPPAGANLAEVYDYGHDGWAVGAPPYMGDYTYPGSPFEGWGLQANVGRTHAFVPGTFTSAAGGSLTGAISGYTNVGGRAICNWTGTASGGGLTVRQETRVDTLASWVVVTTELINTTGAAIPDVYYLRSCDPDNNQTWPGGGFGTNNNVIYQNDANHRVLVRALSSTGPASYLGLGTKDCRAKCFIYNQWSMSTAVNFADMYNQTVPGTYGNYYYDFGAHNGDIGIGLVYNIGTIAAGASAILSYAYIFSDNNGIDSAFPDPQIVINGVPHVSYAPPTPNFDTFNACDYPGLTSIPIDILNATDKNWSWSSWTWSPGLGLSSTTGTSVTISFAGLPPVYTYTIIGTDSATGMYSCNHKIFYLTILTCNGAESNDPCVGDTLYLNAPGDSLGATYQWYGPLPSTAVFSTSQSTFIYPATLSHSGVYSVIKTVAGIPDTSETSVTVYALPALTLSSNQVTCDPIVNPLNLTCISDSVITSYAWSGPGGFTSAIQNPSVSPFDSSLAGLYIVNVVSDHGCKSADTIEIKPGPVANFGFERHPGCPDDTVIFTNLSVHGTTYEWNFGDGFTSYEHNPTHIYKAGHKSYTVKLTVRSANGCSHDTTKTFDLSHTVTAQFDIVDDTICNMVEKAVIIDQSTVTNASGVAAIVSYDWSWGDGESESTPGNPIDHLYPDGGGTYTVKLNIVDALGCPSQATRTVWVLQPEIHALKDSSFCLTSPMTLQAYTTTDPFDIKGLDYTYVWAGAGAGNLATSTDQYPVFNEIGDFTFTITATLDHEGCQDTHVMTLHSILPQVLQGVTTNTYIEYGNSIQLDAHNELFYTWAPNDGSLSNPNINNPIATPTVTTTYTLYGMDYYGCRDTAWVTITVDSSKVEFIPTAFTPNGDGLNDVFRLIGSQFHNMLEFRIYNRWGTQIFYSTTLDHGWDGTYEGQPQDMGVYYYTVIVARPGHPQNKVIKGEVTLIR